MAELLNWDNFAVKIAEYMGMETSEIAQETNVYSDLGMDSLGLFSLGMFLIKTFKRKISLSAVSTIETAGDIFKLMNEEKASQESE
jgi:acyl carrier protein